MAPQRMTVARLVEELAGYDPTWEVWVEHFGAEMSPLVRVGWVEDLDPGEGEPGHCVALFIGER